MVRRPLLSYRYGQGLRGHWQVRFGFQSYCTDRMISEFISMPMPTMYMIHTSLQRFQSEKTVVTYVSFAYNANNIQVEIKLCCKIFSVSTVLCLSKKHSFQESSRFHFMQV